MTNKRINIELDDDQALVLFGWLARFNKREDQDFEDQAEQRVLWDVEAVLEKNIGGLVAPTAYRCARFGPALLSKREMIFVPSQRFVAPIRSR